MRVLQRHALLKRLENLKIVIYRRCILLYGFVAGDIVASETAVDCADTLWLLLQNKNNLASWRYLSLSALISLVDHLDITRCDTEVFSRCIRHLCRRTGAQDVDDVVQCLERTYTRTPRSERQKLYESMDRGFFEMPVPRIRQALIRYGGDLDGVLSKAGTDNIYIAAGNGCKDRVRDAVTRHPDLINSQNGALLRNAALSGDIDMATMLLSMGARDDRHFALAFAIERNHLPIIRGLSRLRLRKDNYHHAYENAYSVDAARILHTSGVGLPKFIGDGPYGPILYHSTDVLRYLVESLHVKVPSFILPYLWDSQWPLEQLEVLIINGADVNARAEFDMFSEAIKFDNDRARGVAAGASVSAERKTALQSYRPSYIRPLLDAEARIPEEVELNIETFNRFISSRADANHPEIAEALISMSQDVWFDDAPITLSTRAHIFSDAAYQ